MIAFIVIITLLLLYTIYSLYRLHIIRKKQEKELEIVFNRISDGVVSVDSNWRYTFLNDAAMATHPYTKEETLGKVIWDVHPEMKGTIFWDTYHEAMTTKKAQEIENYYPPMNIWFSVKVYPAANGLTIFYKDVTTTKLAEQKLSESLKETNDYKYALDESSIVAITDQKGVIQYANDNFCKISKYSREELIGQDHRIINSGYHSKEFIRDLWVTIAHGHIWRGELKNKAKDGTIYWVDTTIVPFLNDLGKPYQYIAIRADITERKKIEENLKKSLKETTDYKYALNESSIVAITDQKGVIQYANDNFCKISKYSRKELIGQDHRIINSGFHPKEFIRELWVTIANGKIWRGELKNKAKDGTIYWVDTTIVPFLNDLGKPYQYVAIRADITERKKIEENLKKSLKETTDYKYALDESSIIAITDQKGVIQYANDNFCRISKYSREELIGQDHRIVNSGYHNKEFIRELWVTIANGKIWRGDIKNKAKDGTTYWVETTIVPFLNASNKPYQYVAIRADITQRKETEVRLSENIQELERSNQELEQFAYIASHDLQEPLRMVGSYMQLIERRYKGKLDKDADDFIHFAIDGATRMKQLIADLLNYSRMNKDGTITLVNMNDVLAEVMQNLSASIKENNGIVGFDNMPVIEADRTQMVQLFQNLVSNALKFKREGIPPVINVNATQQNDKWLFSITDNGIGIERQYSEKVFVVFKQLHTKAKYGGTGIGLAIAKKIVERHGGKIWFESTTGNGTTFYFTLNAKI